MRELVISDVINGKSAILSETGEKVFQEIKKSVDDNEQITLDFTGITTMTTAFLNLAIGQLYDLKPVEELTKLVKIKRSSISDSHFQKIALVLSNSKEKREEFSKLQDEVIEDGY